MTAIYSPVIVDATDLEQLVRQAHTVVESDPMVGLTAEGNVAYGLECACGALFLNDPDDYSPSGWGQHAGHVERAVRNALEGRL